MKHVSICGTTFPAILNQKNRPSRQEGPKTAKIGLYLYLQKYPILAVFGPSCQPGRFFLVQNGWKMCPPYRYMFHVGLAPLGGLLGPNTQLFQKIAIFGCFWAKIGGPLTRERLVKMISFIKQGGHKIQF